LCISLELFLSTATLSSFTRLDDRLELLLFGNGSLAHQVNVNLINIVSKFITDAQIFLGDNG
jgi:hypothetical protein